jgi:uncharacterized protein DUF3455
MTIFATFVNLTRLTATLAVGTLAALDGASAKDGMVEVPAALNPDKLSIFRVVSAKGVQVCTCTRNPAGATGWVLTGPDAQLFDPENKPVGKHYAGPTWEDLDGGKVVGTAKASMPAPVDKAIPWLLLDAKSREGSARSPRRRRSSAWERPAALRPPTAATRPVPIRYCAFPTPRSTCF